MTAYIVPRDTLLPRICIPSFCWAADLRKYPERYKNVLFLAKITKWTDSRFADGYIVQALGVIGDLTVEKMAIKLKYSVNKFPYPEDIKEDYRNMGDITPEEYSTRADFTKECIFTVSAPGDLDLDNAISWKLLPSGGSQVCEIFKKCLIIF